MKFIQQQEWRYATKKFDPTKKVSETDIDTLQTAIQLSASSYGLQPYTILIVENPKVLEQLREASWGQSQVTDASHLFVFCGMTSVDEQYVDEFVRLKADTYGIGFDQLKGYGDFIKSKISTLPPDVATQWTAKQCYIALGNLLSACAEMQIDTCPMEGFEADQYSEILKLESKGLKAAVVAAVGYRADDDQAQHSPKVRRPKEVLFNRI